MFSLPKSWAVRSRIFPSPTTDPNRTHSTIPGKDFFNSVVASINSPGDDSESDFSATSDDDDEEAEALVLDHSFQPVNTTTDAEVGGRRKGKDSSSRFPVQNSLDGPSAEDILLGCSNPARKEDELANDALKFPKDLSLYFDIPKGPVTAF